MKPSFDRIATSDALKSPTKNSRPEGHVLDRVNQTETAEQRSLTNIVQTTLRDKVNV